MEFGFYPLGFGAFWGAEFPWMEDFYPRPKSEKEIIMERARRAVAEEKREARKGHRHNPHTVSGEQE